MLTHTHSRRDIGEECGVAPPLDALSRKHEDGAKVHERPQQVKHHGPQDKLLQATQIAAGRGVRVCVCVCAKANRKKQ